MNKGIEIAKGEFIIFLGADDTFYNDSMNKFINNLIQNRDKDLILF